MNMQAHSSATLLSCTAPGNTVACTVRGDRAHRDSLSKFMLTLLLKFYFMQAATAKALLGYQNSEWLSRIPPELHSKLLQASEFK